MKFELGKGRLSEGNLGVLARSFSNE